MQTARDFLSILERDYHLDFSGSRGSSVETLLRQFVAANRVEARDQGQALMATANANLLHELQKSQADIGALKSEIAAIHSVADEPQYTQADHDLAALTGHPIGTDTVITSPLIIDVAPKEEN